MCGSCIGIIELISSSGFFCCVHFHANALDKGMKPTLLSIWVRLQGRLDSFALDDNQSKSRKTLNPKSSQKKYVLLQVLLP